MTKSDPVRFKQVVIIGGGAAGFFSAINIALKQPQWQITILEKSNKLLSKVRISGGGRCNITHHCFDTGELIKNYPRGNKELRQVFARFSVPDTIRWFSDHGLRLKTEADGRMFPESNTSQSVIDCFMALCTRLGIIIKTGHEVFAIRRGDNKFYLKTSQGQEEADYLVCSTGGHPKAASYDLIKNLGHHIIQPVPSLFTFNLPSEPVRNDLQGISVAEAQIGIAGIRQSYTGPVLITHWGLSGPAVLKLSAFAARDLFETDYNSDIVVNWIYPINLNEAGEEIKKTRAERARALPNANPLFGLPRRLWEFFCESAGLQAGKTWAETGNREMNALATLLTRSVYQMRGKTTFKEEFVTSGGLDLKEVDFRTMESRLVPGLYFCGEVLNIDGVTGGFNFQSAWSTAWIAAGSIAGK